MNAVAGATGLARPFGNVNTNPNSVGYGTLGHDGPHVVAPGGSLVTTLPALTGTVIDIHTGGSPGIPEKTKIVDIMRRRLREVKALLSKSGLPQHRYFVRLTPWTGEQAVAPPEPEPRYPSYSIV